MLTIKDLTASKELDRTEMAAVAGGTGEKSHPGLSLFSPTSIPSFNEQIAATTALGGNSGNVNNMMNTGVNYADKGSQIVAPVFMNSNQTSSADVYQTVIQAAIQSSF